MKYNVLTYLIGEGIANIFKNRKQNFITFIVMCLIMIAFGIAFVAIENSNYFLKQLENNQGIRIFIVNDATEEQIKTLGEQIKELKGINTIEFISKEAALQKMKDRFKEKAALLESIDKDIFPAAYEITLTDLSLNSEIQAQIKVMENVKNITSADEVLDKLMGLAKLIKIISYAIIIGLIVVSVSIISNTIKLTVYARRKEISIMKYVGATNNFIRWPFIVEGIIIGLASGAISLAIVASMYIFLIEHNIEVTKFLSTARLSTLGFSEMFNFILIVYLILGVGTGTFGSISSMKKYLKV